MSGRPTERSEGQSDESSQSTESSSSIARMDDVDADGSIVTRPTDWPLAYHTLRNMKPVQIAGIVERKLRHALVPRLPIDFDERYEQRIPEELTTTTEAIRSNLSRSRAALSAAERSRFRTTATAAADGRYAFLGHAIDLGDPVDWDDERIDELPIVWRLKLEGFEAFERLVLGWESPSDVDVASIRHRLVEQALAWDAESQIGEGPYLRRSWIPHSVSLRVLHWSRYVAWCDGEDVSVPDRLVRMIYKNALFLENHVEREIDGNHLIENAVALLVAGVLFREHDTGWIDVGVELFKEAARTQLLADGGHYERSPMYHVTVLRRYVTAADLLSSSGRPTVVLETAAAHAMGFLESLVEPSGEIPLLNDSVYEEALEAETCLSYARSCSISPISRSLSHPEGSGYRLLRSGSGTLLMDVGDVGPPHLPAHSHNDQLSVLLWIDGKPILTDTGVYDYESPPRRSYARSVAAHNTAQYDRIEPIPVGGSYLMGKRTAVEVVDETDGYVEARYSRRRRLDQSYTHRRTVSIERDGWRIVDSVSGDTDETYTVRHHFHPDVDVHAVEEGTYAVRRDGDAVATVSVSEPESASLDRSPYFEAFGRERLRPLLGVRVDVGADLETTISTPGRSLSFSDDRVGE